MSPPAPEFSRESKLSTIGGRQQWGEDLILPEKRPYLEVSLVYGIEQREGHPLKGCCPNPFLVSVALRSIQPECPHFMDAGKLH